MAVRRLKSVMCFYQFWSTCLKVTGTAVVAVFTLTTTSFGFLLGCTFVGDYFVGVKWTDVLAGVGALLGGVATTCAAYFAYRALSTWKDQFAHSQRYEAFVNFEKSYYDLLAKYEDYKESTLWACRLKNGAIIHPDLEQTAQDNEAIKRNWDRSFVKSTSALEWACTFANSSELQALDGALEITSNLMSQQIQSLENLQRQGAFITYSISLDDMLDTVSKNVKQEVQSIRKQTHNKQFKSDS
ncbi:hypothetical protein [Vibrio parahaemolyticus]|uniref:hypothetical protein n=1 Tax=Vibrio parahaemolyticus TaxID=670 RepID=UPI0023626B39|nr:hypothetical protein [Vibrio parahaemolyticus]MDF4440781.1 hypothetical protein [Vibrio parahaemolyticus]HCG7924779.1 hypothetical protein [Vibrio parahaemolyticus]HCH0780688.1 hypothetical protein [Vibrio parahaemolyticus]